MRQQVSAKHEVVRDFYSDVKNLKRISPPFPKLTIDAEDTRVVEGRDFRMRLDFLVFSVHWLSRIDKVVDGSYFVDTFSGGVFTTWRHTHAYEPSQAGTLLTDEIECSPAFWFTPLAYIGVKGLFMFRRRAIARVLR